jgi:DNA-damage-inducible protein D
MKENQNKNIFEQIKHIDGDIEYWYARELQEVLEYKEWRFFEKVIKNAIINCKNSGIEEKEHFGVYSKTIEMPKNATKEIKDYKLSRYACYLIVQNGNPKNKIIALGKTYFAIQTRKQELTSNEYSLLEENEKRFYQRKLTKQGNYTLNLTAQNAGVKDFAKFHNAGYKGLYDGETADDIFKRKGLRYREDILDNMGSEELAANFFRITQTEAKLKRDDIQGEGNANKIHNRIGKIVRGAIKKADGTMPENLPTPNKSLKELDKEQRRLLDGMKKKKQIDEE